MPLKTRIPARREASGESTSQPRDPLQRGRGRGRSRGRRDVNACRHGSATGVANAEVTLAEFMKLNPPTFSGSNANEDPQRFIDGLERLWRVLSCSDIRAVELASFQVEGVAYDWFDTMTRGRSVGSPPLAWGELPRLFMARFLPESVRDGLAHELERLERTGGLREYIFRSMVGSNYSTFAEVLSLALQLEQRQKEKGGSGRDSRKKQRVEGSQSSHPSVGVGSVPDYQVHQRAVSKRGGSSGKSFDFIPGLVLEIVGCVISTDQACHIKRDYPVVVMQTSSSHASTPAALASSQDPSAPVRLGFLPDLSGCSGIQCSAYRGKELFANLIALDMVDFDVILGMDWLASHNATLDGHNKMVKFEMPGESTFSF
ncbi:Retrotransposon gag domain [Sesbania bispinosa]|nr:Retrotransposon gag domain [Sesbania bispinosa]